MKNLNITYKGANYEVAPLTTGEEFLQSHKISVGDPVAIILNGLVKRLDVKFRTNSTVEFVELSSQLGKRIYESSILFLFVTSFSKLFPDLNVFIQHSIQKGVYAEIHGRELTLEEVNLLKDHMNKLVSKDLEIKKVSRDWDVSMSFMKDKERSDMINLYRYHQPSSFRFYELEGIEESLYLPLLPTTKSLKYFNIEKYRDGVVIIIPDFSENYDIPKFEDRPKLFKTYQEYHEWSRILKVRTVGQLNKYIMNGSISELLKVAEGFHEKKVVQIADQITTDKLSPKRLVLIAGPTSSGKTTFSKRLGIQLMVNGFNTVSISMDNYFVDRADTPRDSQGNFDFESIDAIDVSLFKDHILKLLSGDEVEIPRFDFHTGTKKRSGEILKLEKNEIIVIEGIHGINPILTEGISDNDKFKIYIAPLTQLNLHRHDRIPASDTRLVRRIVRDSFFRGYSANETISRWKSVRAGEKKNIFPLQEEVDIVYNSALFYELSVLKSYAERELLRVDREDPAYPEAQRLLKFLSYFLPLGDKEIPNTSIIKEFIGGSSFAY